MLSYNRTSFLGTDGRSSTDSNPDPIWTEPGLVLLNADPAANRALAEFRVPIRRQRVTRRIDCPGPGKSFLSHAPDKVSLCL